MATSKRNCWLPVWWTTANDLCVHLLISSCAKSRILGLTPASWPRPKGNLSSHIEDYKTLLKQSQAMAFQELQSCCCSWKRWIWSWRDEMRCHKMSPEARQPKAQHQTQLASHLSTTEMMRFPAHAANRMTIPSIFNAAFILIIIIIIIIIVIIIIIIIITGNSFVSSCFGTLSCWLAYACTMYYLCS